MEPLTSSWTGVTPYDAAPTRQGSLSDNTTANTSPMNVGAITGGAAGGGLFVAVACALLYFIRRRRKRWLDDPRGDQKDIGLLNFALLMGFIGTNMLVSPDFRMPSLPVVSEHDLAPSVFDLDSHTESLSRNSPANIYGSSPWIRDDSPRSEYAISDYRASNTS